MLALGRARGGLGFIKARAPKPCGDDANRQPVCVHKHTYMHTGSTAVFGQSTLACDLLCRGPPWFFMHSYLPLCS